MKLRQAKAWIAWPYNQLRYSRLTCIVDYIYLYMHIYKQITVSNCYHLSTSLFIRRLSGKYLTYITKGSISGRRVNEWKPMMFSGQLISMVNLAVTGPTQSRFIGTTENGSLFFFTYITLNLHFLQIYLSSSTLLFSTLNYFNYITSCSSTTTTIYILTNTHASWVSFVCATSYKF